MGINTIKRKVSDCKYNNNIKNKNYGREKKNKINADMMVIATELAISVYVWLYSLLLELGCFSVS
jgi:hypothetical protein